MMVLKTWSAICYFAIHLMVNAIPSCWSIRSTTTVVEFNRLSNNYLVKVLPYGDEKPSNDVNTRILNLTLDFIYKTGRFD